MQDVISLQLYNCIFDSGSQKSERFFAGDTIFEPGLSEQYFPMLIALTFALPQGWRKAVMTRVSGYLVLPYSPLILQVNQWDMLYSGTPSTPHLQHWGMYFVVYVSMLVSLFSF